MSGNSDHPGRAPGIAYCVTGTSTLIFQARAMTFQCCAPQPAIRLAPEEIGQEAVSNEFYKPVSSAPKSVSARPRVRNRSLCHRDYRLIGRELGSVLRGCGLRLPLMAELKREAAELVLDGTNARVAG